MSEYSVPASSVAFSPDGETLASGSRASTITLWDVETGRLIGQQLSEHVHPVYNIAFSPDGKKLALGSWDTIITLWDVETRQLIDQQLRGHTLPPARSVAFSPNGKMLASGSVDNTIILWDLEPQSWIQETCQRAGRNFTSAEWALYFPNERYRKTCEQWPLEPELLATPSPTP